MNPYLLSFFALTAIVLLVTNGRRIFRSEAHARQRFQETQLAGIEPVSLHPALDPNRCISIGACATACPEGDILALVNGRPQLVTPQRCIGHGACEAACPVDAITLVFGTEKRGVEIPHVKETFETDVDHIYIAGELGGMGLIRNAVTQGRQAIDNIAKHRSSDRSIHDVLIVGAGPAGLAATLQAESLGLRYITIDQDGIGGTILNYPRQKLVMTQPMEIPLHGRFDAREVTKEELLELWTGIVTRTGVAVNTHERFNSITQSDNCFEVSTSNTVHRARNILLAVGRRGSPRKLGVVGEESAKVTYKLLEPEQYRDKKVLVVGGGDSAVEAALAISDQSGSTVTLSYRQPTFSRIKEGNAERIAQAVKQGKVEMMWESQVVEVQTDRVLLEQAGSRRAIDNDYVLVMIGGEVPTRMLKEIGVSVEMKYGVA